MESLEILVARAVTMQSESAPVELLPPLDGQLAHRLMERARRFEETGDLSAAIALLERAREAPSHAAAALCEKGRLQRRRGERPEALWTFKRALHHVEDVERTAWIYAEMGQVYFTMREDEEATYYFRRAASMDRRYAHLLERTRSNDDPIDVHALDTADIDITTLQ